MNQEFETNQANVEKNLYNLLTDIYALSYSGAVKMHFITKDIPDEDINLHKILHMHHTYHNELYEETYQALHSYDFSVSTNPLDILNHGMNIIRFLPGPNHNEVSMFIAEQYTRLHERFLSLTQQSFNNSIPHISYFVSKNLTIIHRKRGFAKMLSSPS